jgi:hypothetical protein
MNNKEAIVYCPLVFFFINLHCRSNGQEQAEEAAAAAAQKESSWRETYVAVKASTSASEEDYRQHRGRSR